MTKKGMESTSQTRYYLYFMARTTRNKILMQHFWSPCLKDEFFFLFRNFYRDNVAAETFRAGGVPYMTPGVQCAR
jgi:hypothetical protein